MTGLWGITPRGRHPHQECEGSHNSIVQTGIPSQWPPIRTTFTRPKWRATAYPLDSFLNQRFITQSPSPPPHWSYTTRSLVLTSHRSHPRSSASWHHLLPWPCDTWHCLLSLHGAPGSASRVQHTTHSWLWHLADVFLWTRRHWFRRSLPPPLS